MRTDSSGVLILPAEAWRPAFAEAGQIRYYSLARYALISAFELAGVRHGSRILLPEYLCRDLLAPLNLLGATALWYAVSSGLVPTQSSTEWPIADLVLAVNYFGFPQDLQPFQTYSERTGALVIEDNAHGYLSRDPQRQWLGCRTSLGVFSFRKTLRVPDGAALWISSSFSSYSLPKQLPFDGVGTYPAQLLKAKLRCVPLIGNLAYSLTIKIVRRLRKLLTGYTFPPSDASVEDVLPASPNPWSKLIYSLSAFIETAEIKRRRLAYYECSKVAESVEAMPVFGSLPNFCAPYGYPFRGNITAQDGMRIHAARHGFDLTSWPDLPSEFLISAPDHYRNVFFVNFLQ